jgi:hypothetical protein
MADSPGDFESRDLQTDKYSDMPGISLGTGAMKRGQD